MYLGPFADWLLIWCCEEWYIECIKYSISLQSAVSAAAWRCAYLSSVLIICFQNVAHLSWLGLSKDLSIGMSQPFWHKKSSPRKMESHHRKVYERFMKFTYVPYKVYERFMKYIMYHAKHVSIILWSVLSNYANTYNLGW